MASSRNSAPADDAVAAVTTAVADALDGYVASDARLAVAISGGIDSMVLLDALLEAREDKLLGYGKYKELSAG